MNENGKCLSAQNERSSTTGLPLGVQLEKGRVVAVGTIMTKSFHSNLRVDGNPACPIIVIQITRVKT